MSQAKVDQYKKQKYSRKELKKKAKIKKTVIYTIATLVVVIFVGWIGYSAAYEAGLIKDKMSKTEIESLRQKLIDNGDANVQYDDDETTTVEETTTVAE